MPESIEAYVKALRAALKAADPALAQDAVWDAEAHFRSGLEARQPELGEAEALAALMAAYGTPAEVAAAYLQREELVARALHAPAGLRPAEPDPAPAPWPGLFAVLKTPKAYTSVLYLLMALPVGIFFFIWATTGISLSLGLLVLIVGLPFALAFLASVRLLALAEGRLVEALLDVRMPRRPGLLPEGGSWLARLGKLLGDPHTWTSLAYLLLHLPLGILSFMLMVTGLSLSLGFLAAPIARWVFGQAVTIGWEGATFLNTPAALCLYPVIGFFGLLGTLHLALALGRFQGLLAKHMLVQR